MILVASKMALIINIIILFDIKTFSYWFALQCFFGRDTCDYFPGLLGTVFIFMYILTYIGSGLLLRYAEGATYLAVVQVSMITLIICSAFYCLVSYYSSGCFVLEYFCY